MRVFAFDNSVFAFFTILSVSFQDSAFNIATNAASFLSANAITRRMSSRTSFSISSRLTACVVQGTT
jgi:hypothetical protein